MRASSRIVDGGVETVGRGDPGLRRRERGAKELSSDPRRHERRSA
jgi:hypothetical protein